MTRMYYIQLCLLLVLICHLQAQQSSHPNKTVEAFIDMVLSNLTAVSEYVPPVNNAELLQVSPSQENRIYDYGTFDFVIVGAGGSAGTLLANRLTEIKKWKVLLLEAGGPENDFSDIPGMDSDLYLTDMNWGYLSKPQKRACKAMEQNRCICPRGKVVGGSSTINGKMYVRGNRVDYNYWEQMGNLGWSYKDVLPYFMKTENSNIDNGQIGYHGKGGLLNVNYTEPTVFTSVFLRAKQQLGDKIIDYNGRDQIGASRIQFTIKGNKIASGGRAFIDPFLKRKNLNVSMNSFVVELLIDKETKTAQGVKFIKGGKKYKATAGKEVILSAGVINTPQILMLAGIGPKGELDRIGVETLVDLPVGLNMEDHAAFSGINIRTNQTLFNDSIRVLLEDYLNNHRPFTAAANIDSVAFMNTQFKFSSVPDVQQLVTVPPGYGPYGWKTSNFKKKYADQMAQLARPFNDICIWLILLRPASKGSVTLRSKNPQDFPIIDYNYYAEEKDFITMQRAVQETLRLLDTDAFKSIDAKFTPTLRICTNYTQGSSQYWGCMIEHLTSTLFHPVGTTRMGVSARDSVVSSKLEVHGMKKLRVVDAGVMPKIPSGNTNAPTYMIAEKAADFIKSDHLIFTGCSQTKKKH